MPVGANVRAGENMRNVLGGLLIAAWLLAGRALAQAPVHAPPTAEPTPAVPDAPVLPVPRAPYFQIDRIKCYLYTTEERTRFLSDPDFLDLVTPPNWYLDFQVDLIGPHVKNRLLGVVAPDPVTTSVVRVPQSDLDFTASPRFALSRRLPDYFGAFVLTYRFAATDGGGTVPNHDVFGDGLLRSRLDFNLVDLDYVTADLPLDEVWEARWLAGARFASVFFDSRLSGRFVSQRASNYYVGAGPHAGLDLRRRLPELPGWSLYGRLEGTALVGRITQSFEQTFTLADGTQAGAASNVRVVQAVPVLGLQAGVSWAPQDDVRYSFGYVLEQYWYLGRTPDSRAELTTQGIFFRGEVDF